MKYFLSTWVAPENGYLSSFFPIKKENFRKEILIIKINTKNKKAGIE